MRRRFRSGSILALVFSLTAASAAVAPDGAGRFDRLVIHDPSTRLGIVAESPAAIQGFDDAREGWEAFRRTHGGTWQVWVDRRSGTPTLAQGDGIPWDAAGAPASVSTLEGPARQFVSAYGPLLRVRGGELAFNAVGSGSIGSERAVLVFDRVIAGIPVEGESLSFYLHRGSLVAFGASRWGANDVVPQAVFDADAAWAILRAYMGLTADDGVERVEGGKLVLVATPSPTGEASIYAGPAGGGVDHVLAWRLAARIDGERGTWIGKVDATSGKIIAFYDDDRYAGVKGGVYPISNDLNCADFGCEVDGYPMPYADVTVNRTAVPSNDMGQFPCPTKGNRKSTVYLSGPYVRTQDTCGIATVNANCSADLDFGSGTGTDCATPSGGSAGDTHAGRVTYYHLNRAKDKARYWLPANGWVNQQLLSRPNTNGTCNAFWNGSVNFYRSGGGCRNAGEIAGVASHEYGHGLDQNDGGGYDNPSEAYGDVVAILEERRSCVGRGFFQSGTCSGYGDACLSCSGIRDMDWDARTRHTPATPGNFTRSLCGGGGGPCGRETHCESYVPSESIVDLATRDLPAAGLDASSAWQLAEKLFYISRQGSGGNAFNCTATTSDGCGATSWFNKLRVADDDDGDLSNGTPHGAAIFAAFARHDIACGATADPSNQSTSSCPTLATPSPSATPAAGQVTLSWPEVPGAASYLVLRNDVSCDYSSNVVATVTGGTSYVDAELPPGFPVFYRIQAQDANDACESPVSACVQAAAQ